MEKWNSILFVKIKLFFYPKNTYIVLGQEHPADLRGGKKRSSKLVLTVGRHLVSGLGCGFLFTSSQERKFTYYSEHLLESEREASDFSGETSSSFEFSLSNSAHSTRKS